MSRCSSSLRGNHRSLLLKDRFKLFSVGNLQKNVTRIYSFKTLSYNVSRDQDNDLQLCWEMLMDLMPVASLSSSPSRSFLYVAISMSRASLTFIRSWYSLIWRAMSCLALCRASSRSLMRALASFTASSPRSSASAIWASRLERWEKNNPSSKKVRLLPLFFSILIKEYYIILYTMAHEPWHQNTFYHTCPLMESISDVSLWIMRLRSEISVLVALRSSPYLLADVCISSY